MLALGIRAVSGSKRKALDCGVHVLKQWALYMSTRLAVRSFTQTSPNVASKRSHKDRNGSKAKQKFPPPPKENKKKYIIVKVGQIFKTMGYNYPSN